MVANLFEDYSSTRNGGAVSVPAGDAVELSDRPEEPAHGWLNWKWLCGLGGVAAAATQVWFYRGLVRSSAGEIPALRITSRSTDLRQEVHQKPRLRTVTW